MLFIVKYAVSHENNYEDQSGLTSQLQYGNYLSASTYYLGEKHTNILNIHKIPVSKIKIWQIFYISDVVLATLLLIAFPQVFNFSS